MKTDRMLRWGFIVLSAVVVMAASLWAPSRTHGDSPGADSTKAEKVIRAGIIGLDTSHAIAFTQLLHGKDNRDDLSSVRIVAAYPGGSSDLPASRDRVEEYTRKIRDLGVEIVPTIDALLERVDAVMLLSVDGRPHLEQARGVLATRKPLFIDKPLAGSLRDCYAIAILAERAKAPVFSSSSLRFSSGFQKARRGELPFGEVKGCHAFSPCSLEPHHPDFFWYGIHGVETLYTVMGPGCMTVARTHTAGADTAVGVWRDGRIGVFHGIREGKSGYGALVLGTKGIGLAGEYEGYRPLVVEIVRFFKTGVPPVDIRETLELHAFMAAADESKRQGGKPVAIAEIAATAEREARELIGD